MQPSGFVHLIQPFYANTIEKTVTHSKLKKFYSELYDGLSSPVDINFFKFEKPHFSAVSEGLFEGVKKSYGLNVINTVTSYSESYGEDAVKLVNMMREDLRTVLGRQRRDYGLDQERFPVEFPVEQQAENVDDCPVTNLDMERACGKVDYREKKLRTLKAVSQSMILEGAEKERGSQFSFRSFKEEALALRELNLEWSSKMKEKFKQNADIKQINSQVNERKRLDKLDKLKKLGGPFTDAAEVQSYVQDTEILPKKKKERMKMELQFARDSSTTLPKVDPLFRVMVTMANKKKRDKTPEEFGEAMMVFLGKKSDRVTMEYNSFQNSLEKLTQ